MLVKHRVSSSVLAGIVCTLVLCLTACSNVGSSDGENSRGGNPDNTPGALANPSRPPADNIEFPASGTITVTGSSHLNSVIKGWADGYHADYPSTAVDAAVVGIGHGLGAVEDGDTNIRVSVSSSSTVEVRSSPNVIEIPLAFSANTTLLAIVSTMRPSTAVARSMRSLLEWIINKREGSSSRYLDSFNLKPLSSKQERHALVQIMRIH